MKKMKKLIVLLVLLVSNLTYSQELILADESSVKSFLDDKQFTVGEYGTIKFKYVSYVKDFGMLKFNVEYLIPGGKKGKKIAMVADIMIKLDEFYSPSYVRGFSMKSGNSFTQLNYNLPTNFQLFENGELYFQDRTTLSMTDYLNAIKTGKYSINAGEYKLCN